MTQKINHFCSSGSRGLNNYSQIYLAEPEKRFLEKFGQLTILLNFELKDGSGGKSPNKIKNLTQNLIDFTKNEFYNPLKNVSEIEQEFEDLLQKLNSWLQQEKDHQPELFEKELSEFSFDVAVIKNLDVYFSQIGELTTYFLRNNKLEDLVKEKNKSKKFLNIISGRLEDNSSLFFASKNIFNYFSRDKISTLLTNLSINRSVLEIKNALSEENAIFLIISNYEKEIQTENLTSESDSPKQEKPKKQIKSVHEKKINEPLIKPKIKTDSSAKKPLIKKIIEPIKTIEKNISSNRQKMEKESINTPILTYRKNNFRKFLLIAAVIVVILFVQSVIILGRQKAKRIETEKYNQLIREISQKQTDISVTLVSNDRNQVKTLLNEFKSSLEQLPQETDEQKTNFNIWQEKLNNQYDIFYKVFIVENPTEIVDFISVDQTAKIGGFTNIGDKFYAFNPDNNYIYLFNYQTKKIQLINQSSVNVGRLKILSYLDNDNLIGLDENGEIVNFNTIDKNLLPLKLDKQSEIKEIKDMRIYGRRLYLLSQQNNQIYKYSKTTNGFSKEETWLKESAANISDALSFAIDSSIYILRQNGQIIKFYAGKQENFTSDEFQSDSSVNTNVARTQSSNKIVTDVDFKNFYILDVQNNRLVVFDKSGNLTKQYASQTFNNLKDLIVNKKEDKAWLLNGTKVFEIELK